MSIYRATVTVLKDDDKLKLMQSTVYDELFFIWEKQTGKVKYIDSNKNIIYEGFFMTLINETTHCLLEVSDMKRVI